MDYTEHTQSGRWLAACTCATSDGVMREFAITVRPKQNRPDPAGIHTIEDFFKALDNQWQAVINALSRVDSNLTSDIITAGLQEKIYLFAPALVGSQWYDFMMSFDLCLPGEISAWCIVCMDEGAVASAEVHY